MAMFISGWVNVDNRIICCRNVLCMLHSHFTSFYILPIIYNTDLLLDCSQLYIIRSLLTNIAFLYVLSTVGPMMQRFQSFTNTLSFTDAVIVTDIVFMGMKKTFYALLPPSNTWFHWLTRVCRPKQHFDRFSHFCHAHLCNQHIRRPCCITTCIQAPIAGIVA